MKNTLIRSALLLGFALSLGVGADVHAQQTTSNATVRAQKARGVAGAEDENIKIPRQPNDPNAKQEAPPEKGGPKTRGGSCWVHVDNRTPWYVDIYTDGQYRGQVSPWGDSSGAIGCGNTNLYGVAEFRDGSRYTWGPSVYIINGVFTWRVSL